MVSLSFKSSFIFFFSTIAIVLAICLFSFSALGQNCIQTNGVYNNDLEIVSKISRSQNGNKTVAFADSMLVILNKNNAQKCEVGLWFLFYKSGGLELTDKFEMALDNYYFIIRESEKQNLAKLEASSYLSIARVYEYIGRSKDCLRALVSAKKIIDKHSLQDENSVYSVRYASYHRIFDQKDTARVYALKAVEMGKKYKVLRSQADGYLLLAALTNDKKESIKYLSTAAKLYNQYGDYLGSAAMMLNIGHQYQKMGLLKESIYAADSATFYIKQDATKRKDFYECNMLINELKNEVYFKENKIDSAYLYLTKAHEYKEKTLLMLNDAKIEQNAVDFGIEKEKTINQSYQKTLRFQTIGVLILSLCLLVVIVLLWSNQNKKKLIAKQNEVILHTNESLNEYVEKQNTLLSEVHHRVKNNLQLVISLLTLHGNQPRFEAAKEVFEELSGKVRSISLIHEQLYSQETFDSLNIGDYFKSLCEYYSHLKSEEGKIEFTYDIDSIFLNIETAFPLGIICTELISNSIKYGATPSLPLHIDIKCKKSDATEFILTYKDNGTGYPNNEKKTQKSTMGLTLIKSMARQLQAESRMFNENGACFNMVFNEKKTSVI